ncbi:MAG TPA: hypothetical protein VKK81_15160 [Candidatus Binatia bacterium]|nr:hypothetical protein [Candidatus Binatia bacterium]
MSPQSLLERLVDCERRVRRMYLTLGDRTGFAAEVRYFWHAMAEEERHHVAILERSGGVLDLLELPPQMSEATLAAVEAQIAAAEAVVAQPEVSNDAALSQALILEGSELNRLDEEWFCAFRPTLGALLQAMVPEEEGHIRRLVEAVHMFGNDKALQQQAAALWATYQHQRLGYSLDKTPNRH